MVEVTGDLTPPAPAAEGELEAFARLVAMSVCYQRDAAYLVAKPCAKVRPNSLGVTMERVGA